MNESPFNPPQSSSGFLGFQLSQPLMEVLEPLALQREVEDFLYKEARLLDNGKYLQWLELCTDDIHYWMPGIEDRQRRDPAGTYGPERMAYFDHDKRLLKERAQHLEHPAAWSQDPPVRHLHVISNIEVIPADALRNLDVHSVLILYSSRFENERHTLYARREDRLRRLKDGSLRIARRTILLQDSTLPAPSINTFL
ncbi:3-phenylpropionate/cinnamic acid dioxygenase subunit beta [Streptomyces sp. ME19-01-6]|uniref:3-phenylpropionate/cinnamic acid dioxygenase subunit beta n=1 Tax=Streptomyces sp. ME19-01-6 TaxID=3028686 RepID=UPI0029ADDB21|nr:3-phenylpropionate/cinnamic acid dioxygenase subunit beta [Streptomyces sp. ME19-01-6]MDX3231342.1 3-phenylpropionate/cinnamic acid dioxygenase subunit beta [Streptomyces sp. ME19-01-6]